jgi:hypothetical protein
MAAESAPAHAGVYVYGIFPPDIELARAQTGVGDPPGALRLIRDGDLAALVSEVDPGSPLGTPDDLRVHQEILDRCAAAMPVLPMRFGAVLASADAVVGELLEPHREEFAAALGELEGHAQYVVKGRYDQAVILAEVLADSPEAERLRGEIRDADLAAADPAATRDARIALGELVSQAITARREADTRALGDLMDELCAASLVRDPTHELDAVHVAFLLDEKQAGQLDEVVADLAAEWDGRVELRVLGPMAAYDFVGSLGSGG